MPPIDDTTLDALSDLICGDGEEWYRKGWELSGFFKRAGVECPEHDGTTRKYWVLERLRLTNAVFPEELNKVILRVADPKEYKGNKNITSTVISRLNQIISVEGLEVRLAGVQPTLHERVPTMLESPTVRPSALETPDLSSLVHDPKWKNSLMERWEETCRCLAAGAHLATIVMMGSFLEGVLGRLVEQKPKEANQTASAPKDSAGAVKPFREWTLSDLIRVAHDAGWVDKDVHDFSQTLREYRNLVHPKLQLNTTSPDADTCRICSEVVRAALNDLSKKYV